MPLQQVLDRLSDAVAHADAGLAASCFAENAIYNDGFYGIREGRASIESMFRDRWFRDGERYVWSFRDVVEQAGIGYAWYTFSYISTLPHTRGRHAVMAGCCRFEVLKSGAIADYRDWTTGAAMLVDLGVPWSRIEPVLRREHAHVLQLGAPTPSAHPTS